MKKRILTLLVVLALCLSFTACSSDSDSDRKSSKKKNTASESVDEGKEATQTKQNEDAHVVHTEIAGQSSDAKTAYEQNKRSIPGNPTLTVPEYGSIALKSYAVIDIYNQKSLVLCFDYTNNNASMDLSFLNYIGNLSLYQNGVRISYHPSLADKDCSTAVKNGTSIEVIATYSLRDDSTDVLFEVVDPKSYAENKQDRVCGTYTLKIK